MARSTVTVAQIIADARVIAGAMDYNLPTNTSMLAKINMILPSIYKMLNGSIVSRFSGHSPLGTPAGYYTQLTADSRTYTASTKKITCGTMASSPLGGLVIFYNSNNLECYLSYVTAYTAGTSFTVASGPAANIASGLFYIVLLPPSGTSHTIDEFRLDKMKRIEFPLTGNAYRVNEDVIESLTNIPQYASNNAVVMTGTGDAQVVKVFAGTSVTNNGGTPVIFFDELPKRVTATTDYVDLPTEYHSVLIEELARLTLLEIGGKVPPSLRNSAIETIELISGTWQATQQAYSSNE
jgi:hypothetical protein